MNLATCRYDPLNLWRAQQEDGESMSSEQLAAWFQEDQGTAEFIGLLMRSHFLRDYSGAIPMPPQI